MSDQNRKQRIEETETTEEKVKAFYAEDRVVDLINNLYARWQHESEYEDFADYAALMEKLFEGMDDSFTFVKAVQRPFGMKFKVDGRLFRISASRSRYNLTEL